MRNKGVRQEPNDLTKEMSVTLTKNGSAQRPNKIS